MTAEKDPDFCNTRNIVCPMRDKPLEGLEHVNLVNQSEYVAALEDLGLCSLEQVDGMPCGVEVCLTEGKRSTLRYKLGKFVSKLRGV